MNIFYLASDPRECAVSMCDKHVVKMILEYAQLLSTAHFVLDGNQVGYKPTHINHPCNVWTRASAGNYRWLWSLFMETCAEYTRRYNRMHKTEDLLPILVKKPLNIPQGTFVEPPQCMPEEYRGSSTIQAYRTYYLKDKGRIAVWKYTDPPVWWKNPSV